jgi:hypothetical protein
MVLHNVELNGGMRLLYKDLELPVSTDMLLQPIRNHSLNSAGCTHTAYTVCITEQVSLPTAVPCVKKNETVIPVLYVLLHFYCQVNYTSYTNYSLCAVLVTIYWSHTDLF